MTRTRNRWFAPVSKADEDDDDGFAPKTSQKKQGEGAKQNKPKGKTIYKYSKKNTTFKKK